MAHVQQHLNRFLLAYAVGAMVLGFALGSPLAAWTKAHSSLLGDLTTAGVFLIIFPMMVNVRFAWLAERFAIAHATLELESTDHATDCLPDTERHVPD